MRTTKRDAREVDKVMNVAITVENKPAFVMVPVSTKKMERIVAGRIKAYEQKKTMIYIIKNKLNVAHQNP